jgi:NAD(P)H-flavin reductase
MSGEYLWLMLVLAGLAFSLGGMTGQFLEVRSRKRVEKRESAITESNRIWTAIDYRVQKETELTKRVKKLEDDIY